MLEQNPLPYNQTAIPDCPKPDGAFCLPLWTLQVLLLAICLTLATAGQARPFDTDASRQSANPFTEYFVEQSPIELSNAQELSESAWRAVGDNDVNDGYTSAGHWFRTTLTNPTLDDAERFLEVKNPQLDHIEFYQVSDGRIVKTTITGDQWPFSQRPIASPNFVFPITIPAGETTQVYLRIETEGAMQAPLTLWKERAFFAEKSERLIWHSMFYGMLLVMAIFHFFLFVSIRDKTHLYYVAYTLAILALMMLLHGFSFQYIHPYWPRLNAFLMLFVVPFCSLTLSLFTREFLVVKDKHPYWNRFFQLLIGLSILCVIGSFVLPYGLSTRISVSFTIPVFTANLVAGVALLRAGNKNARFFVIAWLALLIGVLATVFSKLGLLHNSFLISNGIPIGASLQSVLFSLALADRFKRRREAYFQEKELHSRAIQQQRETEAALYRTTSHNELTGLPNRALFEKLSSNILNQPGEHAVFMLHLMNFNEVNKTLGHEHADQFLALFAERINNHLTAETSTLTLENNQGHPVALSHVEGVSFAFLISGDSREEIIESLGPVTLAMADPVEFSGLALEQHFMLGCSFAGPDARNPQTLLRQAFIAFDQSDALYGIPTVYHPGMNPYSPRRLTLMTELREALRTDGLDLHFQPQIHLETKRVAGFEALIRWFHPEHGFIPPDEFIPTAEQTGLIKPLTRWVLEHALAFCKQLDAAGCDATVSVNISAINLREPEFCDEVCTLLTQSDVAAQRLVLEVTETAAMADPARALAVLRALRQSSVRLSIDDFGIGQSSLSYIRKLPVNEIKIDRSFVMQMDESEGDATIVRTTINMCHDLGYEVVAEGVENEAIEKLLGTLGCDLIQGYHIARPMAGEAALEWLATTSWALKRLCIMPERKSMPD